MELNNAETWANDAVIWADKRAKIEVAVYQWYAVGDRTDDFYLVTKIGDKFISCDLYTSEQTNRTSDENGTQWDISPSTSYFVKKTRKGIKWFQYRWRRPMTYDDKSSNGFSMN